MALSPIRIYIICTWKFIWNELEIAKSVRVSSTDTLAISLYLYVIVNAQFILLYFEFSNKILFFELIFVYLLKIKIILFFRVESHFGFLIIFCLYKNICLLKNEKKLQQFAQSFRRIRNQQ